MGCRGLWWGPTVAVFFNTFWYNVIILRMDWPKLIKEIQMRREAEEKIREELALERAQQETCEDDF